MTSDFRPEVEIWPLRACAMHPVIIIGTVRSLWFVDLAMAQIPRFTERNFVHSLTSLTVTLQSFTSATTACA